MSGGVYLFVWVITAIHGGHTGNVYETRYKWENSGYFVDVESCKQAAVTLNIKPEHFRCVSNRTGK